MNWDSNVINNINWNGEISNLEQKEKIANKIANRAKNGDVIGFGSGSTSFLATKAIAKRMKEENLNITAIPTSYEIKMLCTSLGIPTSTLNDLKPDWYFDGADEVDPNGWLIKGRGAAMFKEKLIMKSCSERHILVDNTKFVNTLCTNFPIPVECAPESLSYVKNELINMGVTSCILRLAQRKDGPVITESGNFILDTTFKNIDCNLEMNLKSIVGIIETGLFIGYDVIIEN